MKSFLLSLAVLVVMISGCRCHSDGCSRFEPNDPSKCKECFWGFTLFDGVCVACDAHCRVCTKSGTCEPYGCVNFYGFNSSSSKCEACDSNCRNCTSSGPSKCDPQNCIQGFIFNSDESICEACGSDCNSCDLLGPGTCDPNGCREGYAYVRGKCLECTANCVRCHPVDESAENPVMSCDKCEEHFTATKEMFIHFGLSICRDTIYVSYMSLLQVITLPIALLVLLILAVRR